MSKAGSDLFERLDELTAIAGSFEAILLQQDRRDQRRLAELVDGHARVMQARSHEIDRLRRDGLASGFIAAHLDSSSRHR
jgi:hypothetical protein